MNSEFVEYRVRVKRSSAESFEEALRRFPQQFEIIGDDRDPGITKPATNISWIEDLHSRRDISGSALQVLTSAFGRGKESGWVGTTHLLLALMDDETIACVFQDAGIAKDTIKSKIEQDLSNSPHYHTEDPDIGLYVKSIVAQTSNYRERDVQTTPLHLFRAFLDNLDVQHLLLLNRDELSKLRIAVIRTNLDPAN